MTKQVNQDLVTGGISQFMKGAGVAVVIQLRELRRWQGDDAGVVLLFPCLLNPHLVYSETI